jgi:hypothetical protein
MTAPSRRDRRAARTAQRVTEPTRGRVALILIVAALIVVGVLAQTFLAGPSPARVSAQPIDAVPSANTIDTAWYCAEGTSSAGGRADETVIIGNVGTREASVTVAVHTAGNEQTRDFTVAAGGQQRVKVSDIAAVAEPGVSVYARGGQVVVEHLVAGSDDVALGPCARQASPEWYFAAGVTAKGAFEWLALYNPFPEGALIDIDVLTRDVTGDTTVDRPAERIPSVNVPGRTRVTVGVHDRIGRYTATGLAVRARYGRVVAERSLIFDGFEARKGLAVSLGSPRLGTSFVFPEGVVGEGRSELIAIANPTAVPADVTVASNFEGGITVEPIRTTVPPKTVVNVPVPASPKDLERATVVSSSNPIVAELRIASGKPQAATGIATMIGEPLARRGWVFAAARLSASSNDRYRVFNPGGRDATVRLRFVGATDDAGPEVVIPAGQAATVELKSKNATPSVLLEIAADRPVVAARVSATPGITTSGGMPR